MNVILFPYDEESEILIRYSKMLNNLTIRGLLAPSGFGTCGKTVQGDTMTYIIKNHVEEIEGMDVEALFLVDSLHTIETSVLIEQVEICAKKGLSILVGRELKQEENSIIANICFKYNTRLLKCDDVNSFIVNDNILELHDVHTPIIAVMGSGNRCNKFELQIEFKKQLEKKKYNVSVISSRMCSYFEGIHAYPAFMRSSMQEKMKILAYNQYIKYIEETEKPEVIILGIPGGLMPISRKKVGDFGISVFEILNAVMPDFTVLSLYQDEYMDGYFDEINRLLKYRFNTSADCFNISNYSIDKFTINSSLPLKYLRHKDSEIATQCRSYKNKVFSRITYSEMGDFILETLASYDEIKVL